MSIIKALACVGDLHISIKNGINKEWQVNRFKGFIDYIIDYCIDNQCALALLGDTLDTPTPKKEELSLFLYLLHSAKNAGLTVLLVGGNHEKIADGVSILDYLEVDEFDNLYYRTSLTLDGYITFHLVSHDSVSSYPLPTIEEGHRHIALTHVRSTIAGTYIQEEIAINEFSSHFDLVIAGDIHAPIQLDNLHYTNNPINCEFESKPNCGFIHLDLETLEVTRVTIDTPALVIRKVAASEWPLEVEDSRHFYKYEVTGTPEELREIKTTLTNIKLDKVPLVDEVLTGEVEEIVEPSYLTLEEELSEYMKTLEYSDAYIQNMVEEFKEVS